MAYKMWSLIRNMLGHSFGVHAPTNYKHNQSQWFRGVSLRRFGCASEVEEASSTTAETYKPSKGNRPYSRPHIA